MGNYSLEERVQGSCKVRIRLTNCSLPLFKFKGDGKIVFDFILMDPIYGLSL